VRAGETPALLCDDLRSLVLDSAAHLLVQTKKSKSLTAAHKLAENCLNSGGPRQKWDEMIVAQGADLKAFNHKLALDLTAKVVVELKSEKTGCVSKCDARIIGEVIRDLGGGRLTKDSIINFDVGVDKMAKPRERVEKNSILARIHAADHAQAKSASGRLNAAFEISPKRPAKIPLVVEIIQ
jgi:pyrimidine-nucleoside phosphorylase